MAALAQYNRLDIMPAYRQGFAGPAIANTPVTYRIPHPASHFRVVCVMYRIWLRSC